MPSAPTQVTPVDFNGSVTIFTATQFTFAEILSLILTIIQNDNPQRSEGARELKTLMMECGYIPMIVSGMDQLTFNNSLYIPAVGA